VELSEFQIKMKNKIEIEVKDAWISDHPTVAYWIEKERGFWDGVGVNFTVRTNA
jgi:exopolyphosphatase / guanosine-5'-triphosphate,3'-diphosphate pyrophosphatase